MGFQYCFNKNAFDLYPASTSIFWNDEEKLVHAQYYRELQSKSTLILGLSMETAEITENFP